MQVPMSEPKERRGGTAMVQIPVLPVFKRTSRINRPNAIVF